MGTIFRRGFLIGLFVTSFVAPVSTGEVGREEGGTTAPDGDRLVVHEWGTFTALQDEQGRELTGVNVDDEPVPPFVHNLHPYLLGKPVLSHAHWINRMKGVPRRHPLVTMRLETPVLYFYPPNDEPMQLDVSVAFRGGWLSEFYPLAEADAPGLREDAFDFGELRDDTIGRLTWRNLQVGPENEIPATDWPVWLAPRKVDDAATVTAENGESERYLFYRGIGKLPAPLRVTTDRERGELDLFANFQDVLRPRERAPISHLWLTEIRPDGTSAFRSIPAIEATADGDARLATVSYRFEPGDFDTGNLAALKEQMFQALVQDGLYPDEATALLNTWERAYFVSPGLRVFFLVPRPWTDHYLPLSISEDADVERVMVGRIELITKEQRETLTRLSQIEGGDSTWVAQIQDDNLRADFLAGRDIFDQLDFEMPEAFRLYVSLGRFRNALVIDEEKHRSTEQLRQFITAYALFPYQAVADEEEEAARPAGAGG